MSKEAVKAALDRADEDLNDAHEAADTPLKAFVYIVCAAGRAVLALLRDELDPE
jgi:hypothetical protein